MQNAEARDRQIWAPEGAAMCHPLLRRRSRRLDRGPQPCSVDTREVEWITDAPHLKVVDHPVGEEQQKSSDGLSSVVEHVTLDKDARTCPSTSRLPSRGEHDVDRPAAARAAGACLRYFELGAQGIGLWLIDTVDHRSEQQTFSISERPRLTCRLLVHPPRMPGPALGLPV